MRIDNIRFHPIRLESKRLANQSYEISRDGRIRGSIKKLVDGWKVTVEGRSVYHANHRARSFRTAALMLCRLGMSPSSDGPQDYGDVRTIRVTVSTVWYTVMFHKHGTWVSQDTTGREDLNDYQQARLRAVISEAEKFRKDNP